MLFRSVIGEPALLTVGTAHTNVTCNGYSNGSINVTVSGGTSPYTYIWSDQVTTEDRSNLFAGTYSVSVNDAHSCGPVTATVVITEPGVITITGTSTTNATCYGSSGTADITVTGGTPSYTYSWSDGAGTGNPKSLLAGTWTVTVSDANGCPSAITTVTITEPPQIVITGTSTTNVTCNGYNNGSASVSATGGTVPLTYEWSTSPVQTTQTATGLTVGTYTVTVSDNFCGDFTTTVNITEPSVLTISGSSKTDNTCFDGTDGKISVTVTGGTTPYSYSWSGTGTGTNLRTGLAGAGTAGTTYTVTVSDANSCGPLTMSFTITSSSLSALTVNTTTTDASCWGYSDGRLLMTVSGGNIPYNYTWAGPNGSGATITGTTASMNLTAKPAGTYSITVTDAGLCNFVVTSSHVISTPCSVAGVGDPQLNTSLRYTTLRPTYVNFAWTKNDPAYSSMVIMKMQNASPAGNFAAWPVDNSTYTFNQRFTLAPNIGSNTKIVFYHRDSTSCFIQNLTARTVYHVKVLTYTGSPTTPNSLNIIDDCQPLWCRYGVGETNYKQIQTPFAKDPQADGYINKETSAFTMSNFSPNPSTDLIKFDLDVPFESAYTISIVNDIGQNVLTAFSNQVFSEGKHPIEIPFNLSSGTYLLQVSGGGETAIMIFLVVK